MRNNTINNPSLFDVTALFEDAISEECERSDFAMLTEDTTPRRRRWVLSKDKPVNAVERCDAFGQTFWGLPA